MHFFCKVLSEFCPTSSHRGPLFDSWQGIEFHGICDSLMYPSRVQEVGWAPTAPLSSAGLQLPLSINQKRFNVDTKSRLFYEASISWNCSELFCHVLLCIFALNLYSKRAQWGKASLRDIYTTLCLRQCTLKSWLNCFYIITFIRHMHPYFPRMRPVSVT
jgi:hypothetical protein